MFRKLFQRLLRKKKLLIWCDGCDEWVEPETKDYGLGRYSICGKTYYDINIVLRCPNCRSSESLTKYTKVI